MERILVTGDRGLIGGALARRLLENGHYVINYDIAGDYRRDILDDRSLDIIAGSCTGIVHLAAISRVIRGEQDPERCRMVNIEGTRNVLAAAARCGSRRAPWIIYGSSREVYGQPEELPVRESAPLRPMNVYARSKVAAERLVADATEGAGLRTSIVRFSSVYGSPFDHHDRVVPAFAHAAAVGGVLSVEGSTTLLDFTHVKDVVTALVIMIELMAGDEPPPTMHLVSGKGTTLMELAEMAVEMAGGGSIQVTGSRPYDISTFIGDPGLASRVLGWMPSVPLRQGLGHLIAHFSQEANPPRKHLRGVL